MIKLSLVNDIREANRRGASISELSRQFNIDRKTIRKYLKQSDFNECFPEKVKRPSILDPYKATIDGWLDDDKKVWHKQHHTAQRIYDRLCKEKGYTGSYPTVQRYVYQYKMKRHESDTFLPLVWYPGQAQSDFGEADFETWKGIERLHYLTLSFPYSNQDLVQVFRGETAECVCQGFQDMFEFLGGVPPIVVIDNATGIGRRIGKVIVESQLFLRFRLHYRFEVRFCNPYSGHEKGHVENKVGTVRRNLFVPIPRIVDLESYNISLLTQMSEREDKIHYKKYRPVSSLFKEDKDALLPLPQAHFDVVRYEYRKTDKYGKVKVGGPHFYSSTPQAALREVIVGIRAHSIHIYDQEQTLLAEHRRCFGQEPTDSSDPYAQLEELAIKPGAWFNSELRASFDPGIRQVMDELDPSKRTASLLVLGKLTDKYSPSLSREALMTCLKHDNLSSAQAALYATLMNSGLEPEVSSPDLGVYDDFFQLMEAKS